MKYEVTLRMVEYSTAVVEVEAQCESEAEDNAMEMIGAGDDFDWERDEDCVDFEVSDIALVVAVPSRCGKESQPEEE